LRSRANQNDARFQLRQANKYLIVNAEKSLSFFLLISAIAVNPYWQSHEDANAK